MTLKIFCELLTVHYGGEVKVWIYDLGGFKRAGYSFKAPINNMADDIPVKYLTGKVFSVDVIGDIMIISVNLPTGLK